MRLIDLLPPEQVAVLEQRLLPDPPPDILKARKRGKRRHNVVTARGRGGTPLPIELACHPQDATRRRLKGRPNVPGGYGYVTNPVPQVMAMMASRMDTATSMLHATGKYSVEVDGQSIGRTCSLTYAVALAKMVGTNAQVSEDTRW